MTNGDISAAKALRTNRGGWSGAFNNDCWVGCRYAIQTTVDCEGVGSARGRCVAGVGCAADGASI